MSPTVLLRANKKTNRWLKNGGEVQMGREGIVLEIILGLAGCVCRTLLESSQELYFQKDGKVGLYL